MTIKETMLALAAGIAFLAMPASAGGPVIIEDTAEAPAPRKKLTAIEKTLIAAGILILIGSIADDGSGPAPCVVPDPETPDPC